MMTAEILATDPSIKTNAELMLQVAQLGYLRGSVLDATYGKGGFWKSFRPDFLVALDLKKTGDLVSDFRVMPFRDDTFYTVVLDGPYKLNGKPSLGEFDETYGIDTPTRWQDRHTLIMDGIKESIRVSRKYILVKCQNQVCSGQVRWQTRIFSDYAEQHGVRLVDQFDLLGHRIPQPEGRSQVHARRNNSSLLVFGKGM